MSEKIIEEIFIYKNNKFEPYAIDIDYLGIKINPEKKLGIEFADTGRLLIIEEYGATEITKCSAFLYDTIKKEYLYFAVLRGSKTINLTFINSFSDLMKFQKEYLHPITFIDYLQDIYHRC